MSESQSRIPCSASHAGMALDTRKIIRANPGADIGAPGDGQEILVPIRRILPTAAHDGIVVNLPEHRLYYYPAPTAGKKPIVITYPVSIGRMDWTSPLGPTRIIGKEAHPNWYPPESIRKEHAPAAIRCQRSCHRGHKILWGLQVTPGRRRRHLRDSRDQQSGGRGVGCYPRMHSHVPGRHRRPLRRRHNRH